MSKKKIALIFGGQSGEHEVSCVSAANVLRVIPAEKYDVTPIGIKKDGSWNVYTGSFDDIESGAWKEDTENLKPEIDVIGDLKQFDLIFPVLHGPMGEDGTVQGVFEVAGVPYVGCGVTANAVGMDKIMSKILFESAGIPTCDYVGLTKRQWEQDPEDVADDLIDRLGLPIFVKPANMGSSVGITKAHDREELLAALEKAFTFDRRVIAETFVNAREIETAVLEEDGKIQVAVPGEIIPAKEFYDYEAKYQSGDDSVIVIPADIPEGAKEQIVDYARKAFEALDCSGLSRIDFFLDKDDGEVYINEINTLPGFTNISMYPKMWDALGVSYPELVERLINTADTKKNPTKE